MIIVHFAEYASGGVSTYLFDLIKYQCQLDYVERVYLIVSRYKTDEELLKLRNNKLIIITYPYRRSALGILKLLKMSKIIRRFNPDVVHIHSSFAGMIRIKFIFSKFKNKIVYCSHGWAFNRDINFLKKIMYMIIEKILSFGCRKIINISNSEAKSAKFIGSNKMITIYNAIP